MMPFYSLVLALGLVLASPWWLLRMLTTARYREGLLQRLGFVPAALRRYVNGEPTLWLHAVSVGEVLAASQLIESLDEALGNRLRLVLSTTTRTGQALAQQRFGAERVFYMPLDFRFAVTAYLRALRPQAIVLLESELWPRLLHEARRRSLPTLVVNARVSDRSFRRAHRLRWIWKHVLAKVTLFLAQSDADTERLQALGAPHARTLGNLKYDVRAPRHSQLAENIRQAAAGRPILVAGSLVDERQQYRLEDDLVLNAWAGGILPHHDTLLVLAPRHPETFDRAAQLIKPFRFRRASRWDTPDPTAEPLEIVLLDTIGDLASVYAIATLAFVGGSLVPRGGHNPLEPARFAVPTLIGPSFENFREIVAQLQAAEAIRIVDEENELAQAVVDLLDHPAQAQALGERAQAVFEAQAGATQRAVQQILAQLPAQVRP
ncbi:MAG: 3-deoxy-D-manno-octulosonic acid transferase [Acidobacteriaceae bacterium]|nr:3-deoxy-D-manno-octulosonic acid transferase [Acidobacteriaceae bacterium]